MQSSYARIGKDPRTSGSCITTRAYRVEGWKWKRRQLAWNMLHCSQTVERDWRNVTADVRTGTGWYIPHWISAALDGYSTLIPRQNMLHLLVIGCKCCIIYRGSCYTALVPGWLSMQRDNMYSHYRSDKFSYCTRDMYRRASPDFAWKYDTHPAS